MAEKLAWFDTYVRGDGTRRFSSLRYYRTGADAGWQELEEWHEPETTVLHASPDKQLLAARGDLAGRVEWTYDPADPTPSVGFLTIGPGDVSGLWDSSALEQRANVRTFTSAPLQEPLDLAGHVSAATTFYSDAPSADLFLRVLMSTKTGRSRAWLTAFSASPIPASATACPPRSTSAPSVIASQPATASVSWSPAVPTPTTTATSAAASRPRQPPGSASPIKRSPSEAQTASKSPSPSPAEACTTTWQVHHWIVEPRMRRVVPAKRTNLPEWEG